MWQLAEIFHYENSIRHEISGNWSVVNVVLTTTLILMWQTSDVTSLLVSNVTHILSHTSNDKTQWYIHTIRALPWCRSVLYALEVFYANWFKASQGFCLILAVLCLASALISLTDANSIAFEYSDNKRTWICGLLLWVPSRDAINSILKSWHFHVTFTTITDFTSLYNSIATSISKIKKQTNKQQKKNSFWCLRRCLK